MTIPDAARGIRAVRGGKNGQRGSLLHSTGIIVSGLFRYVDELFVEVGSKNLVKSGKVRPGRKWQSSGWCNEVIAQLRGNPKK